MYKKLLIQSLNKISITIISAFCLFHSSVVNADNSGTLRYEYSSELVRKIESNKTKIQMRPKSRLKYLEFNFPVSGEISTDIENALVDRDSGTFVFAKTLNPTERVKKINSWSAVIALIAKAANKTIPGAKLLRTLGAVENHELRNHLSVSKMSPSEWAISLVPPFTLLALQGTLRIGFAKTRELNVGKTFILHNNNLYDCFVNLEVGTELIPKTNTPYAEVKRNQLVSVSVREAPLFATQKCTNRITKFTKEIPSPEAISRAGYREISKLIALNKKSEINIDWPVSDNVQETLQSPSYTVALQTRASVTLAQLRAVMSTEDYNDLRSRIKINSIDALTKGI